MKQCSKCGKMKEDSKFHSKGYYKNGKPRIDNRCYDCTRRKKIYSQERMLKNVYGLSLDEYNHMLINQDSSCAICSRHDIQLYVDHCHSSGKVRGLLCQHCNSGIGFLKDDPEIIRAALQYLNHQEAR